MKPVGITLFQGPNLHAKHPLVRVTVEVQSLPCLASDELRKRIAARLPDTPEKLFLREVLEGLAAENEEANAADAVARLTRALQNEPFGEPLPVWTEDGRIPGARDILVGMVDPDIGELAARLACRIALQLFGDTRAEQLTQDREALGAAVVGFRKQCTRVGYGTDTRILLAAARARGVPVRKLVRGQRFALLGHGVRRLRVGQNASDLTSGLASRLSNDKELTARALRRVGIPVPRQRTVENSQNLEAAVRDIGFPLAVKAATGSKGVSVTANVRSQEELVAAVAKARRHNSRVLIEEHIQGTDHRLFILNGRMVAAGRRRPAHVVGDGRHSIRTLIEQENARRLARAGYALLLAPLAIDEDSRAVLASQGFTPESVSEHGREVRLRSTGNVAQGALPEDVTDEVHPETVALAIRAVRTVGLDIAGVDVLTTNIARPLSETGGVIVEVNHFPGLGVHYATETQPRDVAGAIIDDLFPAPARGCIPLVAVTGTNGKTTTCRMLEKVFTEAGYCTGLTTTSGSYVGKERVLRGDYANSVGAHSILQDPRVEAAVLETARGGMVKKGLGWDSCDVAVVTNIREDHLGHDNIHSLDAMAQAKGMIVELAREAVVLNAEDTFCRAMAARASAPVWWFSDQPKSALLKTHLAAGGDAVLLEGNGLDERLVHHAGSEQRDLVRVADMPSSLNGLARHNVENALATSAAALAMGLPSEVLARALRRFSLSFEDSPGRLNIRDVDGARIVVDYAHNMDSISRMGRLLETMPISGRRLCMMAVSTRQFEEAMDQLAEAAAPYFDCHIVAGSFRQGVARSVEETAHLMGKSLIKAGIAPDAIVIEADQHKAVDRALDIVRPGDLLLILVGRQYAAAWKKVQALRLGNAADKTAVGGCVDHGRNIHDGNVPVQPGAAAS